MAKPVKRVSAKRLRFMVKVTYKGGSNLVVSYFNSLRCLGVLGVSAVVVLLKCLPQRRKEHRVCAEEKSD